PGGVPGVCGDAPLPGPDGRRLRTSLRAHRRGPAPSRRAGGGPGQAGQAGAARHRSTGAGSRMRIAYYVHHHGLGHRRRATAVARELAVPVTGLGTGPAPEGWPGDWVELVPDDDPVVQDWSLADVTAGG